jgi:hypothetical protein
MKDSDYRPAPLPEEDNDTIFLDLPGLEPPE